MPTFSYHAYYENDEKDAPPGTVEADTRQEAARKLRMSGLIAYRMEEVSDAKVSLSFSSLKKLGAKVKAQQLAEFVRQLATMMAAGVDPLRALQVAGNGATNPLLQATAEDLRSALNQGISLSSAMEQHPKVFDDLMVSLVRASEETGTLDETFNRMADYLEKSAKLKREVRGALMYPIIICLVAGGVVTAMMLFVVPTFASLFEENGAELPMITNVLIKISHFMRSFWYLLPAIPTALIFGTRYALKQDDIRRWWDAMKFKLPMGLGTLVEKIIIARFTRTFSSLLGSGVNILEALDISGPTSNNVVFTEGVRQVRRSIEDGFDASDSFRKANILPEVAIAMIEAGEESGSLDDLMARVAVTYEEQVENTIKTLKTLIEPIMIVFIGLIVLVIALGCYMPMFKIYDTFKE